MSIEQVRDFLLRPRIVLIVYIVAAVVAGVQQIAIGPKLFSMPPPGTFPADIMNHMEYMRLFYGKYLTDYNNYLIFKGSWFHLIHGENLYGIYPSEHWDFYKYSPTFAFFMGLLAYLPDIVGLSVWDVINALALFAAIRMLPLKERSQCLLLWLVALELLTCMQNSQSNGLIAGLMIAGFAWLQRRRMIWAALCIVAATYIKVYGAIGFFLFFLYPDKIKFILYSMLWTIVLAVLPLVVTPYPILLWQYANWVHLIAADQSAAWGLSVMGWLHTWFGVDAKMYITIAGLLLFLLPFTRVRLFHDLVYRLLVLAFMLIWVIIFNHKAESPTFVIAIAGAGIWYFASSVSTWRTIVIWFVLIFTSVSTTDIFPMIVKTSFIYPYKIKVVPCIFLWVVILIELMTMKADKSNLGQIEGVRTAL